MTTDTTIDPRRLTGWHAVVIDEETDNHGKTYRQYIVRDGRRDEVCKVFFVTEEGAAQAHLIAAAPDMLAALSALANAARAPGVVGAMTRADQAALARALGNADVAIAKAEAR